MKVRRYVLTILITLAAASASAQTTRVDELARFEPPFTFQPIAIVQLPDSRIFGFYSGGFNGGIYQITRDAQGAYHTPLIYTFGDTEAAPYDYYGRADTVEAGSDGNIYFASIDRLWRFDPDAHSVVPLHQLAGGTSPYGLTMGLDGHTLFGVMNNGHSYAFDTATSAYRDIADTGEAAIGIWQLKDGNLVVVHSDQSTTNVWLHRLDSATGVENGTILQTRTLALSPTKGDDGEVYLHSRVFGDNHVQRINTTCFCLDTLSLELFPNSPILWSVAGPRNGKYLHIVEGNTHWWDLNTTPPQRARLAVHTATWMVLLPDGTLIMSDFQHLSALDMNTAQPNDHTPIIEVADAPTNDGVDGFPSDFTEGPDGQLYGMSDHFDGRLAPIFRIDPVTRSRALVHTMDVGDHSGYYGTYPDKMLLASDGNFYGTMSFGNGDSAIYRFSPATNVSETLHSFPIDPNTGVPGPDGAYPQRLTQGSDGWLYGVVPYSDDPNFLTGGIFKLDPATGSFLTLAKPANEFGFFPIGPMLEARPGIWIGSYSSYDPDVDACSRLFRFDAATNTVSPLAAMRLDVEGCVSSSARVLARAANGVIYGLAGFGGSPQADPNDYSTLGRGAVFTLDADSGVITQLRHFAFNDAVRSPVGDLSIGADDMLYASLLKHTPPYAYESGVFRFDPAHSVATQLASLGTRGFVANALIMSDGRIAAGTRTPWRVFSVAVMDAIPVAPASGPFGGSTTVSATLKTIGVPLAGRTIAFTINGQSIGSATTNANGVATINHVSLNGIAIGTFANAIGASFAGDDLFPASAGSGSLTVIDVPTPGLMTGDGFIKDNDARYDFGFIVREKANGADRGGFELRKKNQKPRVADDRFVARSLTNVVFSDDPSIRPGRRPRPQVDTVLFAGPGEWNGRSGYRFEAFAQDRGEPGRHRELLRVTIFDAANHVVVTFDKDIDGGNIQSIRIRR